MIKDSFKLSAFIEDKNVFEYIFNYIYSSLIELNSEYPDFEKWFFLRVKKDILKGDRDILFRIRENNITGLSIVKRTNIEKKICTFRVFEKYQKQGIGKSLLLESFDLLNTQTPLITVSSQKEFQFMKLFNYFGFAKSGELSDYYGKNKVEVTYNNILR